MGTHKVNSCGISGFERLCFRLENWETFSQYWSTACFVAHDDRKIPYIGDWKLLNPPKVASITDPSTWRTPHDVLSAIGWDTTGTLVGIGFVLHGDGTVCIDLDGVVDENGNISPEAQRILDRFPNTYAEYSLSGRGIHIWLRTSKPLPASGRRKGNVEIYQDKRYIAITMDILPKRPQHIVDYTDELHKLYHELFSDELPIPPSVDGLVVRSNPTLDADDKKLVDEFLKNPNNAKLWNGGQLPNHPSPSHADCSLAFRLLLYTEGDVVRARRIFSKSPRANREKIRKRPDLIDRAFRKAYPFYLWFISQQPQKRKAYQRKRADHSVNNFTNCEQTTPRETPIDHFVKWFTNFVQPTPNGVVPNEMAYRNYCNHMRSVGQKPLSVKKWGELMDDKNVRIIRMVYNGKLTRCRIGITLVGVEDPFVKWFTNCVRTEPDSVVPNDVAYRHYCDYVRSLGQPPESMAKWARRMDEMGVSLVRRRFGGQRIRCRIGIKLI